MNRVLFISLILLGFSLHSKELVDKVVASLSTDVILYSDLKSFPARISRPGFVDETLLLGEKVSSLEGNSKAQLEYLIREKILDVEIRRLGFGVDEAQVDSEINQMARRNRMSESDFANYLTSQGYTLVEYKKIMRDRIERQSFFEKEIISKLRITDEDALSFYQTNNPNYRQSVGEFKISQIFFSSKRGGDSAALERAQAAYGRYSAGEKFETLANQLDETPGSNADGFLGTFKSGEFIPEIEKVILDLNENQVSKVIRGPNGYHIVKLLSKKSILDPEFLKVKEAIKSKLVQQNFERQLKNWFELKKLDSNIKVYGDGLL